ncbi:hypothetical protein FE634_09640 [Nocardioides dongxiaopingii]|uniref:Gmad2 immunoglobulin-like domain-containing protein n=1 Tax=Nocardioides sp. S-1144 TaxID=2582905 RepID=UPI00110D32F6|nr:Gmad2 immunoglobulin-like domain-containing protein [Nocardioides sp. S-1144]QCW50612.1 hypothetical protein FE634_09640 [Nocardioides sp. S-1144]
MTTPDPWQHRHDRHDDDLRALVGDAVADVEPTDRLAAIRARTTPPPRRGWWAAGGSALLAAAVVVAVAVVVDRGDGDDPDVAAPTTEPTTASPSAPPDTAPAGRTRAVGLYFLGDTPEGTRLFREFQQVPRFDPAQDLLVAVEALAAPDDPDYRTAWPAGSVTGARVVDGQVRVQLSPDAPDDDLALQQLRATVAAASGLQSITFSRGAEPFTVEADPDALALVSISDPREGRTVFGSFTARGVANSFEATVPWQLVDADGTVVAEDSATAEGADDRLYPWETEIDVSDLEPGTYTFVARTDDPTGGEGVAPTQDTRTIVVAAEDAGSGGTGEAGAGTAAYFVGPGPDGPDAPAEVLYRSTSTGATALEALMAGPTDPDHRTRWPEGSLLSYEVGADVVRVVVEGGPTDDALAVQQLVATLQAAEGVDLPVELVDAGGERVVAPTAAQDELVVQSHVQIHAPDEGAVVSGAFTASGVGSSWEGSIFCQLLDAAGDAAWARATVNGGLLDDTLEPWETRVELARVEPGDYTLRCTTDDPTAGTEGRGTDVDTRTLRVG